MTVSQSFVNCYFQVGLKEKGYDVVTELNPAGKFWEAETYHQEYYEKQRAYRKKAYFCKK